MKILKYIAILAVSAIACSAFAQNNAPAEAASPVEVKINNDKGKPVVNVLVKPSKDKKVDMEEAINKAILAVMSKMDPKSVNAKAISAALHSIKVALIQKYETLEKNLHIQVKIENKVDGANNIAVLNTIVSSGNDKYEANTETTYNPATDVAQTNGNVVVTGDNGASTTLPVSVAVNASGELIGSIGNAGVTDTVVTKDPAEVVTQAPTSNQPSATDAVEVLPDNTIVTSGEK